MAGFGRLNHGAIGARGKTTGCGRRVPPGALSDPVWVAKSLSEGKADLNLEVEVEGAVVRVEPRESVCREDTERVEDSAGFFSL